MTAHRRNEQRGRRVEGQIPATRRRRDRGGVHRRPVDAGRGTGVESTLLNGRLRRCQHDRLARTVADGRRIDLGEPDSVHRLNCHDDNFVGCPS